MSESNTHKVPDVLIMNRLRASQQSDEQAVWAQFRAGDQRAFDALMTTQYRTLFRYGNRFSTDPEFIRDSIQDLFLYLWERRASLHAEVSVKPYLLYHYVGKCTGNRPANPLASH